MAQKRLLSLLPLGVFLILFLGTGLYFNIKGIEFAFYQLPAPVAALAGITVAFFITRGTTDKKINAFINGVSDSNFSWQAALLNSHQYK